MERYEIIFVGLFALLILIPIAVIYQAVRIEAQWDSIPVIECDATLVSDIFLPSTESAHFTPLFSGGGMSSAMITTGHGERYSTVWDCGRYGRISCDDNTVYRYATDKAVLYIKVWDEEVRITGIKRESNKVN